MQYSDELINAFQNECTDLVASLEENILRLEKEPDNNDLINELFRLVHSLKSETALMGFNNFSMLAHKYEDLFQQVRDGKLSIESNFIDLSFKITDKFKEMMEKITSFGKDDADIIEVRRLLSNFDKDSKTEKKNVQTEKIKLTQEEIKNFQDKGFKNIFNISITLFDNVALKFARAFMIRADLANIGIVAKSNVNFTDEGNDQQFAEFSIIFLTNKTEKEIYNAIDHSEVEKIYIKKIEAKGEKTGQIIKQKETTADSIRVNVDKIEDLINSVGELIVSHNRMDKFYQTLYNKKFSFNKNDRAAFLDIIFQFKKIIDSLQDNAMNFRMVPVKTLFDKFPRLIRTISKELKKEVNLSISGETTEIDKNVIEEIREPLTHIIRNSIDHGLESKDKRLGKGKPGKGTIKISAYQSGNNINIEIADDGKGLDINKIKKTALKKSLVTEKKLNTLKESQIFSFIFLPGFSTSSNITELSGRGVGLDVVKTNIQKIRGKIAIKTVKDKGMSFIISIPLTVAIINALIIRSSRFYFAIPLYFIKETLRIYENDIKIEDRFEVVKIRKKILYLIRLKEIFPYKDMDTPEKEDNIIFLNTKRKQKKRFFVVVIHYKNKDIGFIVDELITEQDIVIKSLSEYLQKIKGVIGSAILGDGNVAYILDPIKLIDHHLK